MKLAIMKKLLLTISILLLAAACTKQAAVQPAQNRPVSINSLVKAAVEAELAKPETPSGSRLISVQVVDQVSGSKITLNFSKEIQSKGQVVFENTFQRISNAISNIDLGDVKVGNSVNYVILIEGQPLDEYYKSQGATNSKTYTNDQYGFNFLYPNNWKVGEASNMDANFVLNVNILPENKDEESYYPIDIFVVKNTTEQAYISTVLNANKDIPTVQNHESTTLGSLPATHYTIQKTWQQSGKNYGYIEHDTIAIKNGIMYVVKWTNNIPAQNSNDKTIYDQVVLSFKFSK